LIFVNFVGQVSHRSAKMPQWAAPAQHHTETNASIPACRDGVTGDRYAVPRVNADTVDLVGLKMEGVRRRADILNAGPFDEVRLGRADPEDMGDAALERRIRRSASTIWNPTSTCRMGVDERAIVDADLRVFGMEGLRVCDVSVMPSMISAKPMRRLS
jgi:choline dehydrogenase-like flavoprotein